MISDSLFDARVDIRSYLEHPATASCYEGEIRERIEKLLAEMEALQIVLDAPPSLPTREGA